MIGYYDPENSGKKIVTQVLTKIIDVPHGALVVEVSTRQGEKKDPIEITSAPGNGCLASKNSQ